MWLDKARSERFLWFSIEVLNNRKLDLSLGQFNVEKGKHILLLLLLLLLFLKVARNISYGTSLHLFPFITRKYVVICVKRRPIVRRYIHLRENTKIRKYEQFLHFNQHSITLLGIHMRHWAYKREKYTFINANIKVINTILKVNRDN